MTMTNEKLTSEIISLKRRVDRLEGADEMPKPVDPVTNPPAQKPVDHPVGAIDIDLSRAHHMDIYVASGETRVFRFRFRASPANEQWYTHFTAVQLGSGGRLAMAIPAYGYVTKVYLPEASEGVATDGNHTNWVVKKEEDIYLHLENQGTGVTVRLKSNGANSY